MFSHICEKQIITIIIIIINDDDDDDDDILWKWAQRRVCPNMGKENKKCRSPRANYTDRAAAAGRRS